MSVQIGSYFVFQIRFEPTVDVGADQLLVDDDLFELSAGGIVLPGLLRLELGSKPLLVFFLVNRFAALHFQKDDPLGQVFAAAVGQVETSIRFWGTLRFIERLEEQSLWHLDFLVRLKILFFGYALSCTTLRVVAITTRSVVQLNLPTQVFRLDDALDQLFV